MPQKIGQEMTIWVPDSDVVGCMKCSNKFTLLRRRHHCRRCGGIFCYKCSKAVVQGQRMCQTCRSVFLMLSDSVLIYLTSYLSEGEQSAVIQTCRRLTRLVALPFSNLTTPLEIRYRSQKCNSLHQVLGCSFCTDTETGCLRSLRVVNKSSVLSRKPWKQILTESQLLLSASHACVQNLFEITQNESSVVFVSEPLEGVSLESVMRLQKCGVSEGVSASITRQLLQVTLYLHEKLSAVVNNYKLSDIFISLDGTVKLTRLSAAQIVEQQPFQDCGLESPFGIGGSCNSSFSNFSECGWSNSISSSGLGCFERRGVPIPSPVSIPGGTDDELLKKSQLLMRAAEDRRANTAFEGCLSLSVSPSRCRAAIPNHAGDVFQLGAILHYLLTGHVFIAEHVSSSLWMSLSDSASMTVSLMLSPSPYDRPTPKKLLTSFEWLASGAHLVSLPDFVDSFLRFAMSSECSLAH